MSVVKSNALQIGQSATATNNMVWYQPASPDGTVRLGVGNAGATTSDVVTVNSSGNFGLGVTPTNNTLGKTLQVGQAGAWVAESSTNRWWLGSNWYYNSGDKYINNGFATLYSQQNGQHQWLNAASGTAGNAISFTQAMTLDASGNLGIGTSSPVTRLSVTKDGNTYSVLDAYEAQQVSNATIAYTRWVQGSGIANLFGVDTAVGICGTSSNHPFAIRTNNTERARIDSSGNLLVGTTSLVDYGKISINFASSGPNIGIGIKQTNAGSGTLLNFFSQSTQIGSITNTGSNTTAFNGTSDQRLKENIVDAPNALNSVNSIKVRSFDWKNDGSHVDYGYIAQELLEVVPEAVHVPTNPEEMMGVDFGKLTPRLVKAIQELSAQVTTLQAEINALKA